MSDRDQISGNPRPRRKCSIQGGGSSTLLDSDAGGHRVVGGLCAGESRNTLFANRDSASPRPRSLVRPANGDSPRDQYGNRASKSYRRFQRWTRDSAHAALVATNASFVENARSGLDAWRIPEELRRWLSSLLGSESEYTDLASDAGTRELVAQHLVGQVLERHHAYPRMHFYMATCIDDTVRTKDLRCTLRFGQLMRRIHGLLRYAGVVDWFGVKEIQPYVNWEEGLGRDLAPHVHLILMTDGPLSRDQRSRMTQCRRLTSLTDAPVVKITERLYVDGELAQMIAYLLKEPERGANLLPPRIRVQLGRGRSPVRQGYHQYDASIRSDLAIRLTEALSQQRLSQMLISGGEGKAMLSATRVMLLRKRTRQMSITAVADAWLAARTMAGKDQYTPIIIER